MINKYMYILFLGMWMLDERIPKLIINYINSHKPDSFWGSKWIALSTLAGAPDRYSKEINSLVFRMLWKDIK